MLLQQMKTRIVNGTDAPDCYVNLYDVQMRKEHGAIEFWTDEFKGTYLTFVDEGDVIFQYEPNPLRVDFTIVVDPMAKMVILYDQRDPGLQVVHRKSFKELQEGFAYALDLQRMPGKWRDSYIYISNYSEGIPQ